MLEFVEIRGPGESLSFSQFWLYEAVYYIYFVRLLKHFPMMVDTALYTVWFRRYKLPKLHEKKRYTAEQRKKGKSGMKTKRGTYSLST